MSEEKTLGSWQRIDLIHKLREPAALKAVLIAIAKHEQRARGTCFASMNTLARESGFSRNTVFKAIYRLEDLGLIAIDGRLPGDPRGGNRTRTAMMNIEWDALQYLAGPVTACAVAAQVESHASVTDGTTCKDEPVELVQPVRQLVQMIPPACAVATHEGLRRVEEGGKAEGANIRACASAARALSYPPEQEPDKGDGKGKGFLTREELDRREMEAAELRKSPAMKAILELAG